MLFPMSRAIRATHLTEAVGAENVKPSADEEGRTHHEFDALSQVYGVSHSNAASVGIDAHLQAGQQGSEAEQRPKPLTHTACELQDP